LHSLVGKSEGTLLAVNNLQTNYTYYFGRSDRNVTKVTSFNVKGPIVQKGDQFAIHWINLDLVGNTIDFRDIYPLYIVLFNRWTALCVFLYF